MKLETLDCGHLPDIGRPAQVRKDNGTLETIQGWTFVVRDNKKICHACDSKRILDCGHNPSPHNEISTGTAHTSDNNEICWDCVAIEDKKTMIEKGHSRNLPLYLSDKYVSNWPGTLKFPVKYSKAGRHNIAGKRVDVWFNGPDGHVWHGYQLGSWTDIVHCKRTKDTAP